jgi:hypothetical protein
MQSIVWGIEDLIQDIIARSDAAGGHRAYEQPPGERAIKRNMADTQRNHDAWQDEDVFRPMVYPEYGKVRSNFGPETNRRGQSWVRCWRQDVLSFVSYEVDSVGAADREVEC